MKINSKAFISIFLSLILMPVYSVSLLAMDVVKVVSAKNHNLIALNITKYSVLSKYNRELYEKYNIFGIDKGLDYLQEYLEDTLSLNLENKSNFYGVSLKKSIIKIDNKDYLLSDYNFEKQIIDYMKLKGKYNFVNGILNLFNISLELKKYNVVMRKKLDYEEEYSKLDANINLLVEKLNYYNKNYEIINNEFFGLNKKVSIVKKNIAEIESNKSNIIEKSDKNKKEIEYTRNALNRIKKILSDYGKSNEELWRKIAIFEVYYKDIIEILSKISDNMSKVNNKFLEWGESIFDLDNSDIKTNFNAEYKSNKQKFTKDNIDKLLNKLKSNQMSFKNMIDTIREKEYLYIPKINMLEKLKNNKFDLINNKKIESLKKYKIYKYAIEVTNIKKKLKDKRNKAKKNKKQLENFNKKINEISKTKIDEKIYKYISKEDINNIEKNNRNYIGNIEGSSTIKNYKKILGETNELIPDSYNNLLNNIYLAQYILEKFNNKLLKGKEFSSQVEYILFGNEKLNNNINYIDNYIFGIRFSLNSIYAYTNSKLKMEANTIATAISGWNGFGVYIVKSMILASMSFGESILDLENINTNKSIVAFKNNSTWQVSLSGIKNLLSNKIKELSNSAIDNIYNKISDYSGEGIDYIKRYIDEFSAQTIDGLSQSIVGEIISPIQTIIFNNLNSSKEDVLDGINNIFLEIENNINLDNMLINKIKSEVYKYVKNKVLKVFSSITKYNFENYFNNLVSDVENLIKNNTLYLSEELKRNIENILKENKIKQKELVNKYIDSYLSKLNHSNTKKSKVISSGLSFKYKDYLLLVTIFRLCSSDRKEIMNRVALVINSEIKKTSPNFDIKKLIVNFSIYSELKINTYILNKYIFIEPISYEILGGY